MRRQMLVAQSSALALPPSPMELLPRRAMPVLQQEVMTVPSQEEASTVLSLTQLGRTVHLMNMTAMTITTDHPLHKHQMPTAYHPLEAMMPQVHLIQATVPPPLPQEAIELRALLQPGTVPQPQLQGATQPR